jgi:hypothetical protein
METFTCSEIQELQHHIRNAIGGLRLEQRKIAKSINEQIKHFKRIELAFSNFCKEK